MNENKNENKVFNYTYSAKQQSEIKKIRGKYLDQNSDKTEDKMERLRRLDKSASAAGRAAAIIIGIVGTLILGVGMCCVTVWQESMFFMGIIIGTVGIITVCLAYPIYDIITNRARKKIAPEILKLSEELLK